MKNQIKELRQSNGITQAELARRLGIAQSTLSYWEQGKYDIDNDSLRKLSIFFKCSADCILGMKDIQREMPENIIPLKTKKIPLLGEIACGEPILAQEEYGDFVTASADLDVDFCLKAKGDSMIGARIYDGDLVFIRKQPSVNNGEIAAICIDDEATLKRLYYYPEKNKLVLNPENPAYEPLVYIGKELEEVKILGKAIAFQSLVR
mgnify:FL=1